MFESLKENLIHEKKILKDMKQIHRDYSTDPTNREHYIALLHSLNQQLVMLNNLVPRLLEEWSSIKEKTIKKEKQKNKKNIERVSYISPNTGGKSYITINKGDKNSFLKKLMLSEESLEKLKRQKKEESVVISRKPNPFITYSNKYFGRMADKISPSFEGIGRDLKKANIPILLSSFLSLAIAGVVFSFLAGLLIFLVLFILGIVELNFIFLPFGLSFLTGTGFYFYPASESSNVQKKISHELPFATIHMAAVSGSDIEPTRIFKIIASSKEYPNIGYEIKKVLVQVEIYGYDLVTSLKDVGSRTSNRKLADLFSGIATNISTGGELKSYLEKKSENFLIDYRLEREKFSDLAGTFMDVYISILIAAPLILMMMFIVMNVAGLGLGGITINVLLILSVGSVIIVNIIFLFVLNLKQPTV